MIAHPYRHGGPSPEAAAERHRAMNLIAYQLFLKGHVPVIGVNMALPIIQAVGPDHYEEVMMPISLALAERCDAILRVGRHRSAQTRRSSRFGHAACRFTSASTKSRPKPKPS